MKPKYVRPRALLLELHTLIPFGLALAGCGGTEAPLKTADEAPVTHRSESSAPAVSSEIGGLDEDEVDATFKSSLKGLERCLNQGASRVEFLGGAVSFFVQIDTGGQVDAAYLEKSTLGDRETEKCMLSALREKSWPKPVGGLHGLARKSFDFDPPNDVRPPTAWSSERVNSALDKIAGKLASCKSRGRGKYEATLYVATDGSVLAAGVTPPNPKAEAAVDCLAETLKEASFPLPGSWPAKVTFSL